MSYDINKIQKKIDIFSSKTFFKLTDLIISNDVGTNKINGKKFKSDVENLIYRDVKSIGEDSANTE